MRVSVGGLVLPAAILGFFSAILLAQTFDEERFAGLARAVVLDNIAPRVEGELLDSHVEGRVVVEPGASLHRSTVRGPAIVGAGARLTDAYVGPYTAVGEDCRIERAEVEHSILLAGACVVGLDVRVASSLLGRDAKVHRDARQPRAYRFMVGDNCEIGLL